MKKKRLVVLEYTEKRNQVNTICVKVAIEKYKENFSIDMNEETWKWNGKMRHFGESNYNNFGFGVIGVYSITKVKHLNRILNWVREVEKIK